MTAPAGTRRLKDIVSELHPLARTLACKDTEAALKIIAGRFPASGNCRVETIPAGTQAWDWVVPERYEVREAYLAFEDGKRIADYADNPLHLVSYSLPVDRVVSWEELAPHLHFSEKRPDAIPWVFRYYDRTWGFCLAKKIFDSLPRDKRYRVVIKSEFQGAPAGLSVADAVLGPPPAKGAADFGEFIVCANVCHPRQSNDSITGVAVAVELAHRLAERPLPPDSMAVRFLFCPETIGSIAYLSRHPDLILRLRAGLFCEMCGTSEPLTLQRSIRDTHAVDLIARQVLTDAGRPFKELACREGIVNDELVLNNPGVEVPTVSLVRWPYDEYHTSDDRPEILSEDKLRETADVVENIVRTTASNFIPRRTSPGPVFLSKHGLWVDWRTQPKLNEAMDQIMLRMDGRRDVFSISKAVGLGFEETRAFVARFVERGLARALPVPRDGPLG
ncbi:MAG: DUF4910 domain-containing protein [Elusimicrobia bacterium]|nr:DUF4910 domain-containing protein [Elusimicrobiota bacterium]